MDKREVTAIYHRVLNHEAFVGLQAKPRLVVTKFSTPKNKHGHARYGMYGRQAEVKINIWNGLDKYSIEETVIHELAHHLAFQGGDKGHGPAWRRTMDTAFRAIHPEAVRFLAPRVNRYHGRYSAAMRSAAVMTAPTPQERQQVQDLLDDSAALREAAQRLLTPEPQPQPVAVAAAPEAPKPKPYQNILERVFFPSNPDAPGGPTVVRGNVARGRSQRTSRDLSVFRWFENNHEGRPKDAAIELRISEGQVRHALWRLRNDGLVTNHRRGYWRTVG